MPSFVTVKNVNDPPGYFVPKSLMLSAVVRASTTAHLFEMNRVRLSCTSARCHQTEALPIPMVVSIDSVN